MNGSDSGHVKHTVLIADDEPRILKTLSKIVESDGHEVIGAEDGEEALELIKIAHPCIILSDVIMPKIDGLTLCRTVKSQPQTAHIPVILVTGRVSDDDVRAGIEAGAIDYIKKPFDRAEIRMRVGSQIRLHEALLTAEKAEKQLRTITSSTKDAILVVDRELKIIHWNEAAISMFGHTQEEALGKNVYSLLAPERFQEQHAETFQRFVQSQNTGVLERDSELVALRKNGEEFPVEMSLSSVTFDGTWQAVGIVRDIAIRKANDAELSMNMKLEAVGRLAAGIAHEINTPTQFVGDNIHFLKESVEEKNQLLDKYKSAIDILSKTNPQDDLIEEIRDFEETIDVEYLDQQIPLALDSCLEGVGNIASIVSAMKEFSHPSHTEMVEADLNRALETTLTIAKSEYKFVADVKTSFGDLPLVLCYPGDLNQVFLNLIVNAAHALSKVVEESGEKGLISVRSEVEGDSAIIRIRDTGPGIPEAIRHRLFDPFFTTKEVGKGTGQGLSIARSIVVEKHNGSLSFESQEGQGTTFTILLPLGGKKKP